MQHKVLFHSSIYLSPFGVKTRKDSTVKQGMQWVLSKTNCRIFPTLFLILKDIFSQCAKEQTQNNVPWGYQLYA